MFYYNVSFDVMPTVRYTSNKKYTTGKNISFGHGNSYYDSDNLSTNPLDIWKNRLYSAFGVSTTPLESKFKCIDSERKIYVGGMQQYEENPSLLKRLKEAKDVRTVIDIRTKDSAALKEFCEQNKMFYKHCPTQNSSFWKTPSVFKNRNDILNAKKQWLVSKGVSESEIKKSLSVLDSNLQKEHSMFMNEKFMPIVESLRQGKCILGCIYAEDATPKLMSIISRVAPNMNNLMSEFPLNKRHVQLWKNFIENLTKEDITKFGITKTFWESLKTEIKALKL